MKEGRVEAQLQHDLRVMMQRTLQRRRALSWLLAGGSAALLIGCGCGDGMGSPNAPGSGGGTCIANATETNGPFPSDGSNTVNGSVSNVLQESGVMRSDIRPSFGSSTGTADGVPLTLTLKVLNSNSSCAALSGYALYVWHCTRDGMYSLYSAGARDENYLRGLQVSDSNGEVTFTTVFPAAMRGATRIHFEVYPSLSMATLYTNRVLTSQLAFERDLCSAIYQNASGYSASLDNLAGVTIASDGVFATTAPRRWPDDCCGDRQCRCRIHGFHCCRGARLSVGWLGVRLKLRRV
jgi:protocatechuate 3,4-dioxygenase beta subunit